ncbi:MAG TPA: sulfotransferase [Streptosporangiaceae bacterium]|nr:sulfotransferase [Streptosporangiaceae bacterium]
MPPRPHILVVNGRKVRQPVFLIGAPFSGTGLLARALKQSPGFHVTIGQQSVLSVVYAFARNPAIQRDRGEAAATVLRDAFAQAWQVTPHGCLSCSPACRETGRVDGAGTCVEERDITRYGDASPDLMYCAESAVDAFPDARIVQVIRDGRDVTAAMLADAQTLSFFRRGMASGDGKAPDPFFGIETEQDLAAWPGLSPAGKAAMRWRGSVRKMARLRTSLAAEQLTTLRYEQMIRHPAAATAAISDFIGAPMNPIGPRDRLAGAAPPVEPGGWRRLLSAVQLAEIEKVAGQDLRRVGYGS